MRVEYIIVVLLILILSVVTTSQIMMKEDKEENKVVIDSPQSLFYRYPYLVPYRYMGGYRRGHRPYRQGRHGNRGH